ncbi:MAG: hypothetical protein HOB73_03990 [Planctomycetaceae bacterium]|nr:hypothetical protein [Planctomycetaceae bacterium]
MARAIVLVLDHLSAKYIGPYGNTWIPTPGFNQLGTCSLLAESMIASSTDIAEIYTSFLQGQHPVITGPSRVSLLDQLTEKGATSTLISSSAQLLQLPCCDAFTQQVHVPLTDNVESADDIESTVMAGFFGEVLNWLETTEAADQEDLLWIHADSLGKCWDAPVELREMFRGDDDPEASTVTAPPLAHQQHPLEPDEQLQVSHPYAAQVCVVDTCLAAIYSALENYSLEHPSEPILLIVTAARAIPLGQHGTVGYQQAALYSEQLHVPMFASILKAASRVSCSRSQRMLQSESIYQTLVEWFGCVNTNGDELPQCQQSFLPLIADESSVEVCNLANAVAISKTDQSSEIAITTAAWFAKVVAKQVTELFVKPDDRWDINEISDKRRDVTSVIEELFTAGDLQQFPVELPKLLWNQILR